MPLCYLQRYVVTYYAVITGPLSKQDLGWFFVVTVHTYLRFTHGSVHLHHPT